MSEIVKNRFCKPVLADADLVFYQTGGLIVIGKNADPMNGVAACPTHDAAFDTGLITVNGGLRVHRAPELETSVRTDPGVDQYFGQALNPTLYVPERGQAPSDSYLSWHRERIFQGNIGR